MHTCVGGEKPALYTLTPVQFPQHFKFGNFCRIYSNKLTLSCPAMWQVNFQCMWSSMQVFKRTLHMHKQTVHTPFSQFLVHTHTFAYSPIIRLLCRKEKIYSEECITTSFFMEEEERVKLTKIRNRQNLPHVLKIECTFLEVCSSMIYDLTIHYYSHSQQDVNAPSFPDKL